MTKETDSLKKELSARVHNWFQLIPKGFSPSRAGNILETLQCRPEETVLDPFVGEGTTIIECQLRNITSYGIELNPFIYFVCKTITNWNIEAKNAEIFLEEIGLKYERYKGKITFENLDQYGLRLPPIDKPLSWWRKDVIVEILLIKHIIKEIKKVGYADFFLLALASILVPHLTNVKLERHKVFLTEPKRHKIDVFKKFSEKSKLMLNDLRKLNGLGITGNSKLFNIDATRAGELKWNREINCIVTGPPYPERYSYVWATMPHLYLFDYLTHPQQASNLDEQSLGGTWGSATFKLAKEDIKPAYPVIDAVVGPLVKQLRKEDKVTANFVMKYFNLLAKQIMELEKLPSNNLRAAYHVGHSRMKGLIVQTDTLLSQIFYGLNVGYKVIDIEKVGCLFGDDELRESVVYAWK